MHMALRTLAYSVVGAGLITTLTAMAALHPYEHLYFNALVDTKTPGALANRYDMDYWSLAERQSLEYLLARYPGDTLRVWPGRDSHLLALSQEDRDRLIILENPHAADFYLWTNRRGDLRLRSPWIVARYYLHPRIDLMDIPYQPPLHSIRAYGSVITHIVAKDAEAYRAAYADVSANGTPLARADFDIYAYDDALYYISDNCAPPISRDAAIWVFLHIFPADPADLPADGHERGFENMDFRLDTHAAFFEGKCIHRQPLPDYPIERVSTGQFVSGNAVWRVDINLAARAAAQAVHDRILAGDYGPLVSQSDFGVYMSGGNLAYLKENCETGDTDARFFLHIFPADPADLPATSREHGFVNLDFHFTDHGARAGDICVAERELPDYRISRIRTGQNVAGEIIWRADIDLVAHAAAQALYESITAGDYWQPVAQSDFDVYLRGDTLAYLKETCKQGAADARFFLHIIPADPADLPADWRERGFENKDFRFDDHGARIGDKCVAERELPDYPIERIRTGQFISGEGAIWRVEFAAGR